MRQVSRTITVRNNVDLSIARGCALAMLDYYGIPMAYIIARGGQGDSPEGSRSHVLFKCIADLLAEY